MISNSSANQSQILASEPENSTWVRANAGSGKTKVLIDRVTRLLLERASPQHILCLTYTKAAASHMQNKLFERLGTWSMLPDINLREELKKLGETKQHISDEKLSQARRLFARALDTPGGLKIQTIHSFCSSILRRFPMEAGISPHFKELDDRAIKVIQTEILNNLAADDESQVFSSFSTIANLEHPHDLLMEISKYQEFFSNIKNENEIFLTFNLNPNLQLEDVLKIGFLNYDPKTIINSLNLLQQGSANDQKISEKLNQLNLNKIDVKLLLDLSDIFLKKDDNCGAYLERKFPTQKTLSTIGSRLKDFITFKETFCDDLIKAKTIYLNLLAAQETSMLYDFSKLYLSHYKKLKAKKGYLDFDDQILLVKKLLSTSSLAQWVIYQLDGGIEHILIDEAQDTSPAQWEIIKLLTDEFSSGHTANNKKRTIFAVGDEKQSIYSFQGADPAAFDQMKNYFSTKLAGSNDKLSQQKLLYSFRSSPVILMLIDKIFCKENSATNISNEHIAYNSGLPGRIDLWPFMPSTKIDYPNSWFEPVDSIKQSDPNLKLAEKIAVKVKSILESKQIIGDPTRQKVVSPGDFLILLRSRKTLFHAIIKQLKLAGLPVAGADRLNITTELVVKDLLSLFNFLNTPDDDLNFATLLRSPLIGFSEKKLFNLAVNRKKSLWLTFLSKKIENSDTFKFLNDLRNNVDFLRPYELLERILINHNKRANFTARLGLEVEESINALLEQARKFEKSHIPDLTSFILWMESDDVYIKRELETESSTIRVMTIHGSKGLESPIVILPDTSSRTIRSNSNLLKINDTIITLRGNKSSQPQLIEDAISKEREFQTQEEFRLLYVALTRAESWLIICGAGNRNSSSNCWYDIINNAIETSDTMIEENSTYTIKSENWLEAETINEEKDNFRSIEIPEWTEKPNYSEKLFEKIISPSEISGSKSLEGESLQAPEQAKELGSQIHILLENLPEIAPENWNYVGKNILRNMGFFDPKLIVDALDQAIKILKNKEFNFIFSEASIAEIPFQIRLPRLNKLLVSGIIDRIITTKTTVTIIDFKSNFLIPKNENEIPIGILRQMAIYFEALSLIYPDKEIKIAILWTKTPSLMYLNTSRLRMLLEQPLTLDVFNNDS